MTKVTSAADVKGTNHGAHYSKPGVGTKIRHVYDQFRQGEWLTATRAGYAQRQWSHLIGHLSDNYGMEFVSEPIMPIVYSRRGGRPMRQWRLVGEWEGNEFVPLERILQEDMIKDIDTDKLVS